MLTKSKYKNPTNNALKPWAFKLLKGLSELKYLCFFDKDGYPKIVPVIQAQASDKGRIVIPAKPYEEELKELKKGAKIAMLGMNLDMLSVVVQGVFSGFNKSAKGLYGY